MNWTRRPFYRVDAGDKKNLIKSPFDRVEVQVLLIGLIQLVETANEDRVA